VDAVAHVTNALLRTAKSCGPDAPTLASSCWEANADCSWHLPSVALEGLQCRII